MVAVTGSVTADDLLKIELPATRATVSPDGRWLSCAMRSVSTDFEIGVLFMPNGAPHATEGAQVRVWDLESGESTNVGAGLGRSWFPVWSPDSTTIAFYSDANDSVNLWIWSIGDANPRCVSDRALLARPPHFDMDQPRWSPDGRRVLVLLRPDGWVGTPRPKRGVVVESSLDGPTVDVLESPPPPKVHAATRAQNPWAPQSHLAWIDVATGDVEVLAEDLHPQSILLSPDGTQVAVLGHHLREDDPTAAIHMRLDLIDARGGENAVLEVATGLRHSRIDSSLPFPRWSPFDGTLAWVREGVLGVLRPGAQAAEVITSEIQLEEILLGWASPTEVVALRAGDAPSWSGAHTSIWVVSVIDGSARQLALPETCGRPALGEAADGSVAFGDTVLVLSQHEVTRAFEAWTLPLSGEPGTLVHSVAGTLSTAKGLPDGRLLVRYEDEATPPQQWSTTIAFDDIRVLINSNPDLERIRMGRAQFVSWKDTACNEMRGSILMPPDWDGTPVPVVGELYVGLSFSRFAHRWDAIGGTITHQLLAANGIAVFMPDIPALTPAIPPIGGIASFVLPGFDELVAQGLADENRLGVMGQSGGGACVNRILTETNRFKAGIASASISNLASWYGQLRVYDGNPAVGGGHHILEAVMGGAPWEVPQTYIDESPIFHADKIDTPLMLIQGELDGTCGVEQAGEMFTALHRLGKRAVFLRYRGEDHAPSHYTGANRLDVFERVLAWWGEHLLPA